MGYDAWILADSVSACGCRLTTMQITFPRIVLAEFNTHRAFSRNSASSRAIPVAKQIARVLEDPFIPAEWGSNQKGMQAGEPISAESSARARGAWLSARDFAVGQAERLLELGVHKQLTNRLMEPFQWHTVIVTATDWENFYALRCGPEAQPEIREIAIRMREAHERSTPMPVSVFGWHLPLVQPGELIDAPPELLRSFPWISAARCARVSYLTHEGRVDISADLALADRLLTSGHMSPFEHAAQPVSEHGRAVERRVANLTGWASLRSTLPGEAVFRFS